MMDVLIFTDTETGGYQPTTAPLLSVGAYITTHDGAIVDKLYYRVLPPEGTVLQTENGLIDVYTGEPRTGYKWKISKDAADVNGYAAGGFPFRWHQDAVPLEEIADRLEQHYGEYRGSALFVAHNADFDRNFYPKGWWLDEKWACTMKSLKQMNKDRKDSGQALEGAKLEHLRKLAGVHVHDALLQHTALQDAYDCMQGYFALLEEGYAP